MRSPRLFIVVFLALLLVFSQQAAARHALAHYADTSQQDQDFSGAKTCEKCTAFAKFSSALAPGNAIFHTPGLAHQLPRAFFESVPGAAFHLYLSRAPPLPS